MASVPEISVVIPTLNRWPRLEQALSMALGQHAAELEVIVVDDGSSDATPARLAAHSDERVRTHRHETPRGAAAARNAGLRLARGRWTAFLDDDDLWAPTKLREQLDAAASRGAAIAYASAIVLDERGIPLGLDPAPSAENLASEMIRHNAMPGGCSNLIVETALARRVGGFDERLRQLADWDMWIRLAAEGGAAACHDPLVGYVDHDEGMHVREASVTLAELDYMIERHAALARRHDVTMDGGAWVHNWVAANQVRAGRRLGAVRTYLRGARRHRSKGALLRAAVALASRRLAVRDTLAPLQPLDSVPAWIEAAR